MTLRSRYLSLLILLALLAAALPISAPARAQARTLTVTKAADTNDNVCDADCSLREALSQAQNGDTILFANGSATWTIQLSSAFGQLPTLAQGGIAINAGTQRNVIIDGNVLGNAFGLQITSANNIIRGLVINRFRGSLESTGGAGIFISGPSATGNQIYGNYIGIAQNGNDAAGNGFYGILVDNGASNNVIGADNAADRNVIAGNGRADVALLMVSNGSSSIQNNRFVGNYIGINASGSAPINNANLGVEAGVLIADYARTNTIGPNNVIAGYTSTNTASAIAGVSVFSNISSPSANLPTGNQITGNRIGTNAAGTAAIPNLTGVRLAGINYGAVDTTIDSNIISGNDGAGVLVSNTNPIVNTVISNNRIGLDANGNALANGAQGILIFRNDPGAGVTVGPGNTISANGLQGVRIETSGNAVFGNVIGANLTGEQTSGFANGRDNVQIYAGSGNRLGGPNPSDRNVIGLGGQRFVGVALDSGSSATTVQGNYIGLNAAGTGALASSVDSGSTGLFLEGSDGNFIRNNVISANGTGILLQTGADNNQVQGNYIGTDASGNHPSATLGNRRDGINIRGGTGNLIGGVDPAQRNIIANNGRNSSPSTLSPSLWYHGIRFEGASASNNRIEGNLLANNGANNNGSGVGVQGATGIAIVRTETTQNFRDGIQLINSGNNDRAAPTSLSVSLVGGVPTLSGTTDCGANCAIEVFTSASLEIGEGPEYVTRLAATSGNNFNIALPNCKRYLTATVTDSSGNTSSFAAMIDGNNNGCPTAPAEPNVELTAVSATTASVLPPGTALFTYTLHNSGSATGAFAVQSSSSPLSGWNIQINPTSVSLSAGQSTQVRVTVTVPAGVGGQTYSTQIRASVVTGSGTRQAEQPSVTQATKTFGVSITPDNQGGQVTPSASPVAIDYTHIITNTGNGPDTITLSASSTAPSASTSFPDGNQCTNLAAGSSCTRRTRVTVAANSTDNADTTTVTATASNGSANDTATVTTAIRQSAVPRITPTVQTKDALPTNSAIFTYTVTNIGQATGTFTATIPLAPSGWMVTLDPAAPASFQLAPNASRTVTLTMQMPAAPIPDVTGAGNPGYRAQIQVVSSDGGTATADAYTRVLLRPAFEFSAATPNPLNNVAPGQIVSFTHTLTNTGNGADTFSIVVTPTAGLTLLSVTPSNPSLARNASQQIVVSAQVAQGSDPGAQILDVTARTNSTPAPSSITRVDTVDVIATAYPQFSPAQTQNANPGQVVTFTHTLTNSGNQAGVFSLNANAPAAWNPQIVNSNCPVGPSTLDRGTSCQFSIQVTVPNGALAGSYPQISAVAEVNGVSNSVTDTVNVGAALGLAFAPDYTGATRGNADPGQVVTYTHTLTNTGNATDSYTLTLDLSAADLSEGWSATATPLLLSDMSAGAERTVEVVVRAPTGVLAGAIGTVVVTASSTLSPNLQRSVTVETELNGIVSASLIPAEQTRSARPTDTISDTVSFFHTLRNTGSLTISYMLNTTNTLGWTSAVSPTTVGPLASGEEVNVTVSVVVPAGTAIGTSNVTTVAVREAGGPDTVLAEGRDTATVGPTMTILLTPEVNEGTARPGATVVYTHTLANVGIQDDTFTFSTIASLGWETEVAPIAVSLLPNESAEITVTVRVPTSALSGTLDVATLVARSVADPTLFGSAEERTTIVQVARAELSPPLFRNVEPEQQVSLVHTLVNTGNGLDTFDLAVSDEQGWNVTISPRTITLRAGRAYSSIIVSVEVPPDLELDTTDTITVTATSRSDPSVMVSIADVLSNTQDNISVENKRYLYLPVIVRE
jgi:CSLREA domain-containing protein